MVHLFLEAAEHAVPDDQQAAVVAVDVRVVHRVVHAVVAGGAEHPVKPAELAHLLGMHPELVEQVDQRHDAKHQRWHAGNRHGDVEDPAKQGAAAGLAQRGRQVVVLALVVHHVGRPEQGNDVARTVDPVVAEVVKNQRQDDAVPGGPERQVRVDGHGTEHEGVNADAQDLAEYTEELADDAQADAVDGVIEAVGLLARSAAGARAAPGKFQCNQQQKNGGGENDDLVGAHALIFAEQALCETRVNPRDP